MSIERNADILGAEIRARVRRFIAMLSVIAVLVTGSVVADVSAASATNYPSWSDVIKARRSESATKAQIRKIQALLGQLQSDVTTTAADSQAKGTAYQVAEQAYFEKAVTADKLQAQADKAKKTASDSQTRAGQLVALLARSGGNDLTLNLLLDGANASDLLSTMGLASKYSEQANEIYTKALQDKNTAQSLTDQADVAKGILQKLKETAQTAFDIAQKASIAAQDALDASQKHKTQLQVLLTALTTNRKITEKQYLKGIEARYGAGAGLGAGQVSPSGWAKPVAGWITSGFGWRIHPVSGVWRFHSGTDIAGPGCGAPIYAAHSGRVIYAGWYGSYGNFILIQNTNSIQTGYAHIVNGGLLVRVGEYVGVGQNIAHEGTTGDSTGCHLHFEVRINGVAVNSVPFMRQQGITIG